MSRPVIDLSDFKVPTVYWVKDTNIALAVKSFTNDTLTTWENGGYIHSSRVVGLMVADFVHAGGYNKVWHNPRLLAGFGLAWGQKDLRQRAMMDALRMMRPVARPHKEGQVVNRVESVEPDGRMLWGDILTGGACLVETNSTQLLVSVSGMSEGENDLLATTVAKFLGVEISRL